MKKTLKVLMTICAACIITTFANAQNKLKMELGYSISAPLGSFKNNYVNKTSFRGGYGEISYSINPSFSVGLHSGFQSFNQKYDRKVYKLEGNQEVSAVVTNTVDIVPALLKGTYFPLASTVTAKVQPYLSAGVGVSLINYAQYLGEFGSNETSSPVSAQAGAGIQIPFGKNINQTGIKIGATYNYINYNKNQISKLNNVGINAGVVFALK